MVFPYLLVQYPNDHELQRTYSWVIIVFTIVCTATIFVSRPYTPHKRVKSILYESNRTAIYEDFGSESFEMSMAWNKMLMHFAVTIATTQTVTLRFVEQVPFLLLQFIIPLFWAALFPDPTASSNYLQVFGMDLALLLLCLRM